MDDVINSCMGKRSIQSTKQTSRFNLTEYEKFIDIVLDVILQPTFKKLSLVEFRCSIKREYPQLSEKTY